MSTSTKKMFMSSELLIKAYDVQLKTKIDIGFFHNIFKMENIEIMQTFAFSLKKA